MYVFTHPSYVHIILHTFLYWTSFYPNQLKMNINHVDVLISSLLYQLWFFIRIVKNRHNILLLIYRLIENENYFLKFVSNWASLQTSACLPHQVHFLTKFEAHQSAPPIPLCSIIFYWILIRNNLKGVSTQRRGSRPKASTCSPKVVSIELGPDSPKKRREPHPRARIW